jgi:hypothetical protein
MAHARHVPFEAIPVDKRWHLEVQAAQQLRLEQSSSALLQQQLATMLDSDGHRGSAAHARGSQVPADTPEAASGGQDAVPDGHPEQGEGRGCQEAEQGRDPSMEALVEELKERVRPPQCRMLSLESIRTAEVFS